MLKLYLPSKLMTWFCISFVWQMHLSFVKPLKQKQTLTVSAGSGNSDVMWLEITHKNGAMVSLFYLHGIISALLGSRQHTQKHSKRTRVSVLWSTHLEISWTVGYGGGHLNMSVTNLFWFFSLNALLTSVELCWIYMI